MAKRARQATATLLLLAGLAAAPAALAAEPVDLSLLGRTAAGGVGAAEIAAFDPASNRVFVTNADVNRLDVFDFSDPAAPAAVDSIDLAPWGAGPNSVAVSPVLGGIVAVALEAELGAPGSVQVFDTDGTRLAGFPAGSLPDMVTTARGGNILLVANEGEPVADENDADGDGDTDELLVDPEGSVTIIDLTDGIDEALVRTADFRGVPIRGPVRRFLPGSTLAEDLEPEYIAVEGDRAWVSIQEANAVGILDIEAAEFEQVRSLGFKDHGLAANAFDATDDDDAPTIEPHPNVYGMYMPDAIASYTLTSEQPLTAAELAQARRQAVAGALARPQAKRAIKQAGTNAARRARRAGNRPRAVRRARRAAAARARNRIARQARNGVERTRPVEQTLVATANEGDARDWPFFAEESRVGNLSDDFEIELDPAAFDVDGVGADDTDDEVLGRLTVTTTLGDTDGDDEFERLYAFGGRSMSLLDADGRLVFDTGDQLERLAADLDPASYNRDHDEDFFLDPVGEDPSDPDNRSDNKGPEPEAIAVGAVGGVTYAFLGAERSGMIYAFDLSSTPGEAEFAGWINTRGADIDPERDLGPEGMLFVPAADSPTGAPILLVTYEITGTVAAYSLSPGA